MIEEAVIAKQTPAHLHKPNGCIPHSIAPENTANIIPIPVDRIIRVTKTV
jgi:hypothetical protein